ncbi:hypothetical protein P4N68_06820 [Corynebacterium felinum]|uniref:Secreted protein n=1 Tax=Corynebacterium felinum TaxID=131318 RepID=A0ABU2B699_9CORY|nr:hypothetical protein [Corynebacterium felinum]MDF5820794.1 hypothetical protein [Corynebacterium felinum]MDR7354144.1 hypothetical protein [Corynebacterium felinum]WJY96316.1 hypothetical protein CFELI_13710 [Corynebacterium felinum]
MKKLSTLFVSIATATSLGFAAAPAMAQEEPVAVEQTSKDRSSARGSADRNLSSKLSSTLSDNPTSARLSASNSSVIRFFDFITKKVRELINKVINWVQGKSS